MNNEINHRAYFNQYAIELHSPVVVLILSHSSSVAKAWGGERRTCPNYFIASGCVLSAGCIWSRASFPRLPATRAYSVHYSKQNSPERFESVRHSLPFQKMMASTNSVWRMVYSVLGKICVEKIQLAGNVLAMCNEYVKAAHIMGTEIINKEFRGAGDTIQAAANRAGKRYGVSGALLMRIRHRYAEMNDMKVSVWFSIRNAYLKACKNAEMKYRHERGFHEVDTAFVRLADVVAGAENEKE